jgi:integrase
MRKQTGCLVRRGGWWLLRYRMRVMENGQLHSVNRAHKLCCVDSNHKTKASVRDMARDFLKPINDASDEQSPTSRLSEFVEKVYLPWVKDHKRPSTYKGYEDMWKGHLNARCGDWWLRDARTADIQRLLDQIAKEDGLSKTTLKHIKHLLSGIYRFAMQQGLFERANPVTAASIPDAPGPSETYAYSLEEVTQMVAVLPEPAATVVLAAAFTGFRRGELCGMLWQNLEPPTEKSLATYSVTRSIWNGISTDPKTSKSKAPVPIIGMLAKRLEAHRTAYGNPASGPIFANGLGKPVELNNLYRRTLRPIFQAAGIEWHGWHAFRRGLATNLHRLGVDDKTIQAILRHSNVAVTQACYIKTVSADAIAAMQQLESAIPFSHCSQQPASKLLN